MGYVLSAYVVDHDSIANAIGSGDDALVSAVVRSNPDEFDDEDDFPPGTKRPTLRGALQQLVDGESGVSDDPQYRYAFEELCRFLGKLAIADRLDPEEIGLRQLFAAALPFPVLNPGDFPRLAYVPVDGIDAELKRTKSLQNGDPAESSEESANAWLRCLKSAKRERCGVVLVYG
jgi:hypothetical protein